MTRPATRWALLLLLCACGACGDDDGTTTPSGDAGGADAEASGETRSLALRFHDGEGAPLEGVKVAVDTDTGRFETQSAASEDAELTVTYGEPRYDAIFALERFVIEARTDQALPPETETASDLVTLEAVDALTPSRPARTWRTRFGRSGGSRRLPLATRSR